MTTGIADRAVHREVEVSIVMPCLNEAETLAACIQKAQATIQEHHLSAEIVIADNGSSDGSQAIATGLGARVVSVEQRGYGNALRGGIRAARGKYIVMADTDGSHDLGAIYPFLVKLRSGYHLVMGNRFKGGIQRGAMKWTHRWIGNPVLTRLGRLFFRCPVGDFHCGLRAFTKDAYRRMGLHSTGMEFASEMVIRASLSGLRIAELPTVHYKDGRSRPPHLRTWRDGWRHLRFMLLFSPRWLFLTPGAALFTAGLGTFLWLIAGFGQVRPATLEVQTLVISGFICLVGYQLIVFAVFTKIFAILHGLHPPHQQLNRLMHHVTLEVGVLAGMAMAFLGLLALVAALSGWRTVGAADPMTTIRQAIPAAMLMALGIQTIFVSFFLSVLGVGVNVKNARGNSGHQAHGTVPHRLRHQTVVAQSSPLGGQ